jgi:hypothetical protein
VVSQRTLICGVRSRDRSAGTNDKEGCYVDKLQMLNDRRPAIVQSNRNIKRNTYTDSQLPRVLLVVGAASNSIGRVVDDNMSKKAYHVKVESPLQPLS